MRCLTLDNPRTRQTPNLAEDFPNRTRQVSMSAGHALRRLTTHLSLAGFSSIALIKRKTVGLI